MGEKLVAVLVVDDEPLVRLVSVGMVKETGFVALEAGNADEAISLIEMGEHNIRVVFTDIDMPGSMDGFKLA